MAYLLHIIFQNQGIEPGIVMGTRTHNEPVSPGERAFMLASTSKAMADGDTPVKVGNFAEKKGGKK